MKVVFDHQIFSFQNHGGISRYFHELIQGLGRLEDVAPRLALAFSNNEYLAAAASPGCRPFFPNRPFPYRENVIAAFNRVVSLAAIGKGADIIHPTYYSPYFLEKLGCKPFVLTVFDMIHEIFPDSYRTQRSDMSGRKRILIEKAARIIAISENTKRDILRFHPVDPRKIHVIHLGDSFSRSAMAPARHAGLPDKYILFVGLRNLYKNFGFFAESLSELFAQESDLHLICVGGGNFTAEEQALLSRLGIAGRTRQVSANDRQLAGYYRQAALFAFPSRYEGFGIPVLEAFACDCPMAASRTSSLPEIAGDAAAYFAPDDAASILATVRSLLNDSAARETLRRKGRERLKLFAWEVTARRTRDLYREICEPAA